jgi:hypothetical protein
MNASASRFRYGSIGACLLAFLVLAPAVLADTAEIEKFVRARIEIGESMTQYMRQQRQPMDRSPEGMRAMEDEINGMVARILGGYGLTIDEYQARAPKVFEDETSVKAFLEANPDLKTRYEALPLNQSRGRRGP